MTGLSSQYFHFDDVRNTWISHLSFTGTAHREENDAFEVLNSAYLSYVLSILILWTG